MKVLSLFSEYSREFGYRNVEGSKILLSAKAESKIRQEHPGLVDANKDSILEEVVWLNTDRLKSGLIFKVAGPQTWAFLYSRYMMFLNFPNQNHGRELGPDFNRT